MDSTLQNGQPFLYSMPGVRAQLFYPEHWRAFMQFFYTRRENPQAKPLLCMSHSFISFVVLTIACIH
jgi:hypothetical protein